MTNACGSCGWWHAAALMLVLWWANGASAAVDIGPLTCPPGSFNGEVPFSWDAPTQNTDGSTLTDLASYEVHSGPSQGNYTAIDGVSDITETQATLRVCDPGDVFLSMKSVNARGVRSGFSNEVQLMAMQIPDPMPPGNFEQDPTRIITIIDCPAGYTCEITVTPVPNGS